MQVRPSTPEDGERVVRIWSEAVDATHHFLSPEDREAIGREVDAYLPSAPLTLITDANGLPIGFMALSDGHLDALFVDPAYHGFGAGRRLVEYAAASHPVLTVNVNAENEAALGFYLHLGFEETGRSPVDDQGRPYPLIHLRLDN